MTVVDWWPVRQFVLPYLDQVDAWPMIGTPSWFELEHNDPVKWASILDAAQRDALRWDSQQELLAEASRDISQAVDCPSVVRGIRRRESGIYVGREVA